jgi:N-acetylmuramoyl-L-alanine amidase
MAFLVWTGSLAWGGPSDPPAEVRGIIAIDPGHGGKQAGSRGPQGSPEKEICLALARQLALFLEPDFRVILTREDDYDLPLLERTGIANHHRADLFISLHAAAGFAPATGGITIFTFKPAEQADGERSQAPPATPGAVAWHQLQIPHAAASRAVATLFQQQFETMPGAPPVRTSQGPLLVLAGANMPALLIEVGQLTHAATEALLSSPDGQTIYAQAMARAIDSFFAAKLRSTRP